MAAPEFPRFNAANAASNVAKSGCVVPRDRAKLFTPKIKFPTASAKVITLRALETVADDEFTFETVTSYHPGVRSAVTATVIELTVSDTTRC